MFDSSPAELVIGGIYLPPALLVGLLGLVLTWLAAKVLYRTRLVRFLWNPPLALLAVWALMCAIIGLCVLQP